MSIKLSNKIQTLFGKLKIYIKVDSSVIVKVEKSENIALHAFSGKI
jgi:hypothetical protein